MVKILALVKKSLWLITTCLLCLIDQFLMHVHHLSCRCINLKMDLSNNIKRNVARFRIRGHGLKCETGLYGRSPDRSARVCNLCENGDYIQDEKTLFFLVWAPNIYGTSSTIYLIIFLKVISKVLFQHKSEVYIFISAAVNLFH